MFSDQRRAEVRDVALARAVADETIVAAAVTGSGAGYRADRWSDVDLFFGVADGVALGDALEAWSSFVYAELNALHHFDLGGGSTRYRAFLLADLLEIDIGFAPAAEFGPLGDGPFRLVFGATVERRTGRPDPAHAIGLAWHHVLHARASIERDHRWQAEYWISAIRDETIALGCLRRGLPSAYAKGAHLLPAELTEPLADALVRSLDPTELRRALDVATRALLTELAATDPAAAARLDAPPREAGLA